MFWTHKRKERPSSFDGSEIAIQLSSGGFYQTEQPIKSQNQMYCVYPYEEDNDTSFSAFTLDCIRLVLADFPFVLESAMGHDIYPIDCYPLIEAYRNAGGQFILAEKHRLLAKVSAPALVTLMPEFDRRFFECEFYAYREVLSDAQVQSVANDLRNSNFSLRIYYHECHDYFLIETSEDPSNCIKHIQELCSLEGRKLFL